MTSSDEPLVTIANFPNLIEAEAAAAYLRGEGFQADVHDGAMANVYPYAVPARIRVPEDQAEEALRCLRTQLPDSSEEIPPADPSLLPEAERRLVSEEESVPVQEAPPPRLPASVEREGFLLLAISVGPWILLGLSHLAWPNLSTSWNSAARILAAAIADLAWMILLALCLRQRPNDGTRLGFVGDRIDLLHGVILFLGARSLGLLFDHLGIPFFGLIRFLPRLITPSNEIPYSLYLFSQTFGKLWLAVVIALCIDLFSRRSGSRPAAVIPTLAILTLWSLDAGPDWAPYLFGSHAAYVLYLSFFRRAFPLFLAGVLEFCYLENMNR